jgi:geranylgeranyl pyrophosphate synthase
MIQLKNEALELLTGIEESPSKHALIGLVEYSIERKK